MPDFTPRPTVYKGIKMRSRLEAGYAQWLDSWSFKWAYEPMAFASKDGQYLPDFRLDDVPCIGSGRIQPSTCYVEVKADVPIDLEALRRRMRLILTSEAGPVELLLARPGLPLLCACYDSWVPMTWAYDVTPGPEYREYLILGMQPSEVHPWPHGYWEGPK